MFSNSKVQFKLVIPYLKRFIVRLIASETLFLFQIILIDFVLRYPQLAFNDDEEWKLKVVLSLHDEETRLFLSDIVHVWVFVVEGDLQRSPVVVLKEILVFHLFCEEDVLILAVFHTKTELIGQSSEYLVHCGDLERVDVVE